jgi:tRNA nucleotidyltransferase/poly(A) polymerase
MKVLSASFLPSLIRSINASGLRDKVWLVGGAVRDNFLHREVSDYDFAVDGDAVDLARQFADDLNAGFYILDQSRGTARVVEQEHGHLLRTYDFARLRGADIETDLMSRDFTVNAMGYDVLSEEELLDPCGGVQDLRDSKLRVCSKSSIMDDPVRTIRAVRLASQLKFQIVPDTVELVREGIPGLVGVSPERKRDELFEMLKDPRPERALRLLDHFGITQIVFSSSGAGGDLEPHPMAPGSLHVVAAAVNLTAILDDLKNPDAVANATLGLTITQLGRFRPSINSYLNRYMGYDHRIVQLFYFAALLAAPPGEIRSSSPLTEREISLHIQHAKKAERISRTLRLSNLEAEWIRKCLNSQIEFGDGRRAPSDTPRNMYRYYRKVGEAGVAGILLYLARVIGAEASPPDQRSWAIQLETAESFFSAYFETPHDSISPEPFLKGDEMMALLGIESGPEIGSLLELMLEAQVSKEVNSKEEAIDFVKENLRSIQDK